MKETYPNGWAFYAIEDRWLGRGRAWAWNPEAGTRDPDVLGWITPEKIEAYRDEVRARPLIRSGPSGDSAASRGAGAATCEVATVERG